MEDLHERLGVIGALILSSIVSMFRASLLFGSYDDLSENADQDSATDRRRDINRDPLMLHRRKALARISVYISTPPPNG